MTSNPFKGLGTALVTPFTREGAVDEAAMARLVKQQVEGGVDMLIPCGTTGEAVTLADEEYERVVSITVREAAKKALVVAGAGSNSTARTIHHATLAKQCGADGVLVVGPYYNKPTQEGFFQHFRAVTEAVRIPTILYNVPGRTSSNIDAATQVRIAKLEYVAGVKEASGNLSQIMQILLHKPADFHLLSGDDNLTLPLIAIGAAGVVSVIANELPGEFAKMVHAALAGDWETARRIHYLLLPLMEANFIESNPIPVKAALSIMGTIEEAYRLPLVPMSPANKERLIQAMKQAGISV